MLYFHKVLPVLLLPTGLSITLLLISLVWRKRIFGWIALALLWVCSTPVVGNFSMRTVEGWQGRRPIAELSTVDAIVVLSGALTTPPSADGHYEFNDAVDRFEGGISLWHAGKAPRLIFTGTQVPWLPHAPSEGEVLAARAAETGIPEELIFVTDKVGNTAGEAQAVADYFRDTVVFEGRESDEKPSILLVTSAFHMRRAQLLFSQAGLEVIPFPVDFRVNDGTAVTILRVLPSARSLANTETALREMYGYWFYRLLNR